MKVKNYVKLLCVALVLCMAVCGLTACGAKTVAINVIDKGVTTAIEATTDMTVADALSNANITLATKDETEPAKDTKITEEVTEITVKRYAKVTVVYEDQKKELEILGGTVNDAVLQAGFQVAEDVKPDADPAEYLTDGMTINLVQGVNVTINVDGTTKQVKTYTLTVEAMLKEQNIALSKDDEVSEELTAKPVEGMEITVYRVTYKEVTETETIDYETEVSYSDSMSSGSSEVTQQGAEGEKTVTYKVKYIDGEEDSREVVSEKVTKEPVTEKITKGSGSSGSGDSGSGSSGDDSGSGGGVYEVSRQAVPNCDDASHGYYIVTWSDGSVTYEEY